MDLLDEDVRRADPALPLAEREEVVDAAGRVARAAIIARGRRRPWWSPARVHARRGAVVVGAGITALALMGAAAYVGLTFAQVAGRDVAATASAVDADGESCTVGVWVLPQEELYDETANSFALGFSRAENLIGTDLDIYEPDGSAALLGGDTDDTDGPSAFDRSRFEAARARVAETDWSADLAGAIASHSVEADISLAALEAIEAELDAAGTPLDINTALFAATLCDAP
ncbi:MAG: hypothetical protein QM602_12605 [Microbacterium sp.]